MSGICKNPRTDSHTQIQGAFTLFGPILMEPQLHQLGTFDSCIQCELHIGEYLFII